MKKNSSGIYILDSTLREGEQTPTVIFSPIEKLILFCRLINFPIWAIEVGMYGTSDINNLFIRNIILLAKRIKKNRTKIPKICVSVLCKKKAIQSMLELFCPDIIFLIVPFNEKLQMSLKFKIEAIRDIAQVIKKKKVDIKNVHIAMMGISVSQPAQLNFIIDRISYLLKLGFESFWIADTSGKMKPNDIGILFKNIKFKIPESSSIKFGAHFHNDYGLALANSVNFLDNYGCFISSSFNGLGERTGITATEELLSIYFEKDIIVDQLKETSNLVEKLSGIRRGDLKPIVGKKINFHDSGVSLALLLKGTDIIPGNIDKLTSLLTPKVGYNYLKKYFENITNTEINEDIIKSLLFYFKNSYKDTNINDKTMSYWDEEIIEEIKNLIKSFK